MISTHHALRFTDVPLVPTDIPDSVISTEAHGVLTLTLFPSIFTELCEILVSQDQSMQIQSMPTMNEEIFIKGINCYSYLLDQNISIILH